ncbi:hypothetical protein CEXT_383881 [Caerostris extrusa]|uniref:Uncharacterized protein n=1 Tax=Caerostris extrusa TaxID=172846 RepID=A0AAV4UJ21_CAEEX|nr:hypothetical protein CEXT_383881 [Caerostris extrusa]
MCQKKILCMLRNKFWGCHFEIHILVLKKNNAASQQLVQDFCTITFVHVLEENTSLACRKVMQHLIRYTRTKAMEVGLRSRTLCRVFVISSVISVDASVICFICPNCTLTCLVSDACVAI